MRISKSKTLWGIISIFKDKPLMLGFKIIEKSDNKHSKPKGQLV